MRKIERISIHEIIEHYDGVPETLYDVLLGYIGVIIENVCYITEYDSNAIAFEMRVTKYRPWYVGAGSTGFMHAGSYIITFDGIYKSIHNQCIVSHSDPQCFKKFKQHVEIQA